MREVFRCGDQLILAAIGGGDRLFAALKAAL